MTENDVEYCMCNLFLKDQLFDGPAHNLRHASKAERR